MAKPITDEEELDPIVRAAMIPDPEDEPSSEEKDKKVPEDKKESEAEKSKDEDKPDGDKKPEADKDKEDPNKDAPEDPEADKDKTDGDQRKSRKERREERKQAFIERIRREGTQKSEPEAKKSDEEPYKPLDYSKQDQFDEKELEQDRNKYAEAKSREAAEAARKETEFKADQTRFWDSLTHEANLLVKDPKFAFLDENSPGFDADRAADVNEFYLELVGFDNKTKVVQRTDLAYDKFVKEYFRRLDDYAEVQQAETVKSLASQQATAGIRPSGSSSTGMKKLKPGDISRMTPEEVEKNEAEIDRQIMAELTGE